MDIYTKDKIHTLEFKYPIMKSINLTMRLGKDSKVVQKGDILKLTTTEQVLKGVAKVTNVEFNTLGELEDTFTMWSTCQSKGEVIEVLKDRYDLQTDDLWDLELTLIYFLPQEIDQQASY